MRLKLKHENLQNKTHGLKRKHNYTKVTQVVFWLQYPVFHFQRIINIIMYKNRFKQTNHKHAIIESEKMHYLPISKIPIHISRVLINRCLPILMLINITLISGTWKRFGSV